MQHTAKLQKMLTGWSVTHARYETTYTSDTVRFCTSVIHS